MGDIEWKETKTLMPRLNVVRKGEAAMIGTETGKYTVREMKDACMAVSLGAPTYSGTSPHGDASVKNAYVQAMVISELHFEAHTSHNEDALLVLDWLNKHYPER